MSLPASITDDLLSRLTGLVASSGGDTYKMTEVYTGEVITALPQSSEADIARAFAESRRAQSEWASWPADRKLAWRLAWDRTPEGAAHMRSQARHVAPVATAT